MPSGAVHPNSAKLAQRNISLGSARRRAPGSRLFARKRALGRDTNQAMVRSRRFTPPRTDRRSPFAPPSRSPATAGESRRAQSRRWQADRAGACGSRPHDRCRDRCPSAIAGAQTRPPHGQARRRRSASRSRPLSTITDMWPGVCPIVSAKVRPGATCSPDRRRSILLSRRPRIRALAARHALEPVRNARRGLRIDPEIPFRRLRSHSSRLESARCRRSHRSLPTGGRRGHG